MSIQAPLFERFSQLSRRFENMEKAYSSASVKGASIRQVPRPDPGDFQASVKAPLLSLTEQSSVLHRRNQRNHAV